MRRFSASNQFLMSAPWYGKKPSLNSASSMTDRAASAKKCLGGCTCLVGAWTVGAKHRPVHVQAHAAIDPAEDGCAGADFDVVRMSADAKNGQALARTCKSKELHPIFLSASTEAGPGGRIEEPRHRAFLDEVLEDLLVLQRVHRAPEAFVPEGHELVGFDQALEWRLDEFITVAHVVEYLLAEDEEAAVDPEIGVLAGADALDLPARPHVNQMQAERRPHRGEAGDLSARAEGLDHFRQIDVGKTVAVVGEEHLLARDMLAHRPQPLADIAPDAGVDHRDAPVLLRIAEDLDLVAETRDDAVGVGLRFVVQEVFLDDVSLVAKAKDEVLVPELAVVVHQVPKNRLVADRNHRLRNAFGNVPNASAETAAEQNCFHLSGLCSCVYVASSAL